jgi:hypothetical protein
MSNYPTSKERIALNLISERLGESFINRTAEEYAAIKAKLPPIKVLHSAEDGEDEVHRADVLVIGRVDPSPPAMRMTVVRGFCLGAICHDALPYVFKVASLAVARTQLVSSKSKPSNV